MIECRQPSTPIDRSFFSCVDSGVDSSIERFHPDPMQTGTGKRTAKVRATLTKRAIEALQPADKAWIAWDDKLTGFGIRIHPRAPSPSS